MSRYIYHYITIRYNCGSTNIAIAIIILHGNRNHIIDFSGGQMQACFKNPNVNQRGQITISIGRQIVVPQARFNCNGRITRIAASMGISLLGPNLPLFQVWHPTSSIYHKVGEVELPPGDYITGPTNYYFSNLSLNINSQIEFQSGDIIGYYQPTDSQHLIYSIQSTEYNSLSNTVTNPTNSIDIGNVDNIEPQRQPLIEITFGKIMQRLHIW